MRTYIVDTYAWVSYFEERKEYKELIEGSYLETPSIVIAELGRVLRRRKVAPHLFDKVMGFVIKRSVILPLGEEDALKAAEIAEKERLNLVDAIVYSYASEEKHLLSGDEHFRGKKSVLLVK